MGLLHLFSFFSIFFISFSINTEATENFAKLVVTSEGKINVPSDQVEISLEVISEKKDVANALSTNNKKMAKIISNLNQLGLEKSEYQTSNFSVTPIYTTPPKEADPNWISKIETYRVSNILQVKTQKISLVGRIIDTAINAGANSLQNLSFGINNEESHQDSLIKNAAQKALNKATSLTKEFGQRIVKVQEISMSDKPEAPIYKRMMFSSSPGTGTAVESGNIELKTSVKVVFEIEPETVTVN